MPFNATAWNAALDALDETAAGAGPITFVGVHQSSGDPGTTLTAGGTEATGGSPAYARKAATWGAASAGQKSNTGTFTFDVAAGTYAYFGLWNALTGNSGTQYLGYIPFGGTTPLKGFASVDPTLSNADYFSVAHGMANTDRVIIYNEFGTALSTGLTEGTIYFVVGSATNTFQLSATSGGAAIVPTVLGSGAFFWQRVVPEVFASQGQITVAAAALILDATTM
jgi:hypothetical protein